MQYDDNSNYEKDNNDEEGEEFTFYPSCEGGNKRGSPEQGLATAIAQLFDDHEPNDENRPPQ